MRLKSADSIRRWIYDKLSFSWTEIVDLIEVTYEYDVHVSVGDTGHFVRLTEPEEAYSLLRIEGAVLEIRYGNLWKPVTGYRPVPVIV